MSLVVKLSLILMFPTLTFAAEMHGVKLADEIDIGGQKLVLNGYGFAPSHEHGETYVAALYLQSKNANAENIISNPQSKILRLTFLRALDKAALRKLWAANYRRACAKDCAKAQPNLEAWNDLMVGVDAKQTIQLGFDEDGVSFKFESKEPHTGHVSSKAFQTILLASFLVHAKSDSLRDGLLGSGPNLDTPPAKPMPK